MDIVTKQKIDGSWMSTHVPSGKVTHGESATESEDAMRDLLGMEQDGSFSEPPTSERFEGIAKDIALHLEGPVSQMLAAHSGFARLEAFEDGMAHVRLGGGCKGCPSSLFTIAGGVKQDLQDKFGEDVVAEVMPVPE